MEYAAPPSFLYVLGQLAKLATENGRRDKKVGKKDDERGD